jgi:hypothetical protein
MTRIILGTLLLGSLSLLSLGCRSEPEIDGRPLGEWVNLLRHQDYGMQEQAQEALARFGAGSLPYLKRALKTTDSTMRRNATRTLARMGPVAREALPEMLMRLGREKVPLLRAELVTAMAAIDPADAGVREAFQKRLRDQDEDVRRAAQAGLDRTDPAKQAKPEPAPDISAPFEDSLVLRESVALALQQKHPGALAGLVAEVARAERRAAILWPAFADGKPLDDDVVAWVFSRQGASGWGLVAEVGPLRGEQASGRLAEALGGADGQRVVRPCGVPREELSAYLHTWGQAFASAQAAGRLEEAVSAYEKLSQAFAFPLVAFDDALPEMLLKGAFNQPWKLDLSVPGELVPVEMSLGERVQQGQALLRPCGAGLVIAELRPSASPPPPPPSP